MRVRDWAEILDDVADSNVDPEGWRAVAGDRRSGVGEDMYLGHPAGGVYHVKTYAKNPFEVQGVGAEVARKLDDEIGSYFPEKQGSGHFAVQTPPEDEDEAEETATRLEEVVKAHAEAPTDPEHFFEDVMDALDSPAFGPMDYDQYDRPEGVEAMADTFEEAEELLDAELEDLVDGDGVGRGFQ